MTATLTATGQITLPEEVREQLRLSEGDAFDVAVDDGGRLILSRQFPVTALKGFLAHRVTGPSSIEELDDAMAQAISDHVDSSKW